MGLVGVVPSARPKAPRGHGPDVPGSGPHRHVTVSTLQRPARHHNSIKVRRTQSMFKKERVALGSSSAAVGARTHCGGVRRGRLSPPGLALGPAGLRARAGPRRPPRRPGESALLVLAAGREPSAFLGSRPRLPSEKPATSGRVCLTHPSLWPSPILPSTFRGASDDTGPRGYPERASCLRSADEQTECHLRPPFCPVSGHLPAGTGDHGMSAVGRCDPACHRHRRAKRNVSEEKRQRPSRRRFTHSFLLSPGLSGGNQRRVLA